MPVPATLDVVYTWVDMNWPGYLDECRRYHTQPAHLNPERYRDHYGLLRYSLRSLERYFPCVRNVYLLTARPQVPAWLRRDHPRLRLVHHDEVAEARHLPTFNSNAIESHLHLLPGLGDHFLYLNDDFLFGRDTGSADFFAPDGRMKLMGSWFGEPLPFRLYEGKLNLFGFGLIEHTPIPVDRPLWVEMLASRPAEVEATRRQKFRHDHDLRMDKLYRQFLLTRHRDRIVVEPFWRLLHYHTFHKIENGFARQQRAFARLRRHPPKFYCLNDDQRGTPDPQVSALVRAFLEEQYPTPSRFEQPAG